MSWNNVIPADLLLTEPTVAKPIELPRMYIPEEYITSVAYGYEVKDKDGKTIEGVFGHEDHPYFASTRRWLSRRGFIEIPEYPCVNGDRVLKPFYLNDVLFEVGEKFFSAGAMHYHLKRKQK